MRTSRMLTLLGAVLLALASTRCNCGGGGVYDESKPGALPGKVNEALRRVEYGTAADYRVSPRFLNLAAKEMGVSAAEVIRGAVEVSMFPSTASMI